MIYINVSLLLAQRSYVDLKLDDDAANIDHHQHFNTLSVTTTRTQNTSHQTYKQTQPTNDRCTHHTNQCQYEHAATICRDMGW